MKVLFVSSGNSQYLIVPFIKNQGDSLIKEGVQVEFFPIIGKGISGYFKNVRKLKKHLKIHKPDIIHAHYSLIGLVVLLTFTRIPVVLSLMGSDTYGDYNID